MPDNKQKKGLHDRLRVSAHDRSEVEYVHSKFPKLSHQQITGAIRAAGPMRKDIMQYLLKKGIKE